MKKKIIINGETVEYLNIEEKPDGTTVITYSKSFNLLTASMREIYQRLSENGMHAQVFKELRHNFISIIFFNDDDVNGLLHIFNIPAGSYDLNMEDQMIVVNTKFLVDSVNEQEEHMEMEA